MAAVALGLSVTLDAQRHGRPDSAQNSAKSIPEPTLKITIDGASTRWKREAFAAMAKGPAAVPARKPASSRVFTGVPLSQLIPAGATSRGPDVDEIHHGFFQTRRLNASDLQPGTDLLIADQIDQKNIGKGSPFYVIAMTRDSKPIVIGKVTSIVIHPTQR
jgi:hypothetical protein